MSRVQLVAVLVSLAGVGVSIYLTILHYAGAVPGCPVTGTINCEAVLSSPYALIAGLPVPTSAAGIAWFGVSAVLWTRQLHWMHPVWAAIGLVTVVYLDLPLVHGGARPGGRHRADHRDTVAGEGYGQGVIGIPTKSEATP